MLAVMLDDHITNKNNRPKQIDLYELKTEIQW